MQRVARFVRRGRIGDRVAHTILNRRQPGRERVADLRDLHGRGLLREADHPVAFAVAGQVDQDVDRVAADPPRELRVGKSGRLAPAAGELLEGLGDVVLAGVVAVQRDRELLAVEPLQQRDQHLGEPPAAKVGGHEGDAQPAVGILVDRGDRRIRVVAGDADAPLPRRVALPGEAHGVPGDSVPFEVLAKQLLRRNARVEQQSPQEQAARPGGAAAAVHDRPHLRDRLLHLAAVDQRVGEPGAVFGIRGDQRDRRPEGFDGVGDLSLGQQQRGELGVRVGELGVHPQREAQDGQRLVEVPLKAQRAAERVEDLPVVREQPRGGAVFRRRLVDPPAQLERAAEEHARRRRLRLARRPLPRGRLGLHLLRHRLIVQPERIHEARQRQVRLGVPGLGGEALDPAVDRVVRLPAVDERQRRDVITLRGESRIEQDRLFRLGDRVVDAVQRPQRGGEVHVEHTGAGL
jgi:hypothetical protein